MTDKENIEVVVPEETPVSVEIDEITGEAKPVEKKVEVEKNPDDREIATAELRRQIDEQNAALEREKQARQRAETLAKQRDEEAKTAKIEVQDSRLGMILNAIDSTEKTAEGAERAYADAMASGDWNAAAKAQRLMAQAESQLLQLKNGKSALEERQSSHPIEGRIDNRQNEIQRIEPPIDPVEALATRLTPKSADWLRAHPRAAGQISKLTAAHQAAVELEGIPVESPEYFSYIEQRLGMNKPPVQEKTTSRASLASVPVSSSSSGSGSRSNSSGMTLNPSEVEMALQFEPNLPREKAIEAYARSKAALIKDGKLSA